MKGLLPNHGTEFLAISRDVFNGQVDAKALATVMASCALSAFLKSAQKMDPC
jgi:tRNA(His) 5'-end guanylyltransferase